MKINTGLVILISALLLVAGCLVGLAINKTEVIEIEKPVITEKVVEVCGIDCCPAIEMPDTFLSVKAEKKAIAEDVATAELSDKDLKEFLADEINEALDIDLDRKDILFIDIRDVDVDLSRETATVEFTAKITVNDDGDEEVVKADFSVFVTDLVYDDNYEDAEVDDFGNFELVRCYNDYC